MKETTRDYGGSGFRLRNVLLALAIVYYEVLYLGGLAAAGEGFSTPNSAVQYRDASVKLQGNVDFRGRITFKQRRISYSPHHPGPRLCREYAVPVDEQASVDSRSDGTWRGYIANFGTPVQVKTLFGALTNASEEAGTYYVAVFELHDCQDVNASTCVIGPLMAFRKIPQGASVGGEPSAQSPNTTLDKNMLYLLAVGMDQAIMVDPEAPIRSPLLGFSFPPSPGENPFYLSSGPQGGSGMVTQSLWYPELHGTPQAIVGSRNPDLHPDKPAIGFELCSHQ
eukprot:gb/GECG01011147.1/.p1 GENE.gb/GECG01011147.1/~~gb/GECG01011147.1/.p1  ORF type:complete len:281 (+),score=18.01 gb/GECG01011147.1/:1-843(+)